MSIPCIIIMVIGIAIALYGMNIQKKGAAIGQPLAIIGAILAIGCALWNATKNFGGDDAAIAREQRYIKVEHKMLGQEIARQIPGLKKVAVFVDANNYFDSWGEELPQKREDYGLIGLKEGLGSGVEVDELYITPKKIAKPAPQKDSNGNEIPPMPPMMGEMGMMTPKQLKDLVGRAKDAEVIVVLNQLPPMVPLAASMAQFKGKKVALANSASPEDCGAVFQDGGKQTGELICVVVSKRSAVYDDSIPSSDQAAFDKRYALITKDNYKTAIAEAMSEGKK